MSLQLKQLQLETKFVFGLLLYMRTRSGEPKLKRAVAVFREDLQPETSYNPLEPHKKFLSGNLARDSTTLDTSTRLL